MKPGRTPAGRRPPHGPQDENRPERAMRAALTTAGIPFIQEYTGFRVVQPDFLLPAKRLVIEVDGTYFHSFPRQKRRDLIKNKFYLSHGYHVLRFSDTEVLGNPSGCIKRILAVTGP